MARITATGLGLVAVLRSVTPFASVSALLLAPVEYRAELPMGPIAVLLGVSVALALATWRRIARVRLVSQAELFAQVHVDILLLTALLIMIGGTANPFAPLFVLLVPMAATATALRPALIWTTVGSTLLALWIVRVVDVPLPAELLPADPWLRLHKDGTIVNYAVIATVLAFYATRTIRGVLHRERMLNEARRQLMRSESIVAIGALAAGYAHELGTPLGTIAVLVSELKRTRAHDTRLREDLDIVEAQLLACKHTISSLSHAADHGRAETGSGAPVDEFLRSVVARVRALRSHATIALDLDLRAHPPVILAEETLRQAITNLVENAVRASPSDVTLHAGWSLESLHITVRDRGSGFPAEFVESLGKCVQGQARRQGLGFGLLLSATIIEGLGGRLHFCNAPDGGAVSEALIPLSSILVNPERNLR